MNVSENVIPQEPAESGSVQAAIEMIQSWDLSFVKRLLVEKYGMTDQYVESLESQYKKYVIMLALNPHTLFPMSAPVDEFAHMHISCTRDYMAFCNSIKEGYFIHHDPTVTDEERSALLPEYRERTIPTIQRIFGEIDLQFWPENKCVCRYNLTTQLAVH